jgi:hypothetical protein
VVANSGGAGVVVTRGPARHARTLGVQVSPTGGIAPLANTAVRDGRKLVFFLPGQTLPAGTQVLVRTFQRISAGALKGIADALLVRSADDASAPVPESADACTALRTQIHELSGEVVALTRKAAAGHGSAGAAGLTAARDSAVRSQSDLCNPISGKPKQDPITIGPDLGLEPDIKRHTNQDTIDTPLAAAASGPAPYSFPVAGYVTQFQVRGWAEGGGAGISFIIVRPLGGGRYLALQYAGNYLLPGADGVTTFKTGYGVPVQPGDTFGVYNNGGVDWHIFNSGGPGTFEHQELTLDEGESWAPDVLREQTLINATELPNG